MYRKFIKTLENWNDNDKRKPMLIMGARQIGKTWLIQHFCEKTYTDWIYINLEKNENYISAFENELDPENILKNLSILTGKKITNSTTIFIDEIQQSERAISSLKYFNESNKNYKIICAGSLLGIKIKRFKSSFPVGKVEIYNMYPLDFEEFLLACNEKLLIDKIKDSFVHKAALPDAIHKKALSLYNDYIFVGGMPENINDYILKEKNIININEKISDDIITSYLADMTKYTEGAAEGVKITQTYHSIPRQLARENPKFKYKTIKETANKRDFYSSLDWLIASGLVYPVKKLSAPFSPLKGYIDEDSMKIYLSDVGLLSNIVGLKPRDILSTNHNIYKGAVTENYVMQQLASNNHILNYFSPSASMEIDLIYDGKEGIIPIEIKSGRHKRSTSLKNYIEKYKPDFAIRISENNFGQNNRIFAIPLYAIFCISDYL